MLNNSYVCFFLTKLKLPTSFMWIGKKTEWHKSHTDLSKYFIEKIKQKVDPTEIISNKHKTTNGYTLIHEIIHATELVRKRNKFKRRLKSLIEEAQSKEISTSIINDFIVLKYFPDIKDYFIKYKFNLSVSDKSLANFVIKLKVFAKRLDNYYYQYLEKEFKKIDFKSSEFKRNAEQLDKLIELLVPYIIYYGYSATSVSNISYRFVQKTHGFHSPMRIISHFKGSPSKLKFLLHVSKKSKELKYIKDKINRKKIQLTVVEYKSIKNQILPKALKQIKTTNDSEFIELSSEHIDPHNFLRNLYDQGLKRYVASKNRYSLSHFNDFFDNSYWKFAKSNNHLYENSKFSHDPINVVQRVSTLYTTLDRVALDYGFKFKQDKELPIIPDLHQSIYFYNLALGSKSIENSLSMLWTALESLIPYRLKESDIDNVKYFVGKSLSFGAFSRDLMSLISRCVELNSLEKDCLKDLDIDCSLIRHNPSDISSWARWLTKKFDSDKDPYPIFKQYSNLICNTFCDLNNMYNGTDVKKSKVKYWSSRMNSSCISIEHQLDRIYLHRNQIVHSGKFINEYSNLWSNLEWYVGKLLSYAFIKLLPNNGTTLESAFLELESDYDQITNIFKVNKDKSISELADSFELIFKHPWQAF